MRNDKPRNISAIIYDAILTFLGVTCSSFFYEQMKNKWILKTQERRSRTQIH